ASARMTTLMPVLRIEGKDYVMVTPQLAGLASKHIGAWLADLSPQRDEITAALDLLMTGF
ncbi:MAG: CcdB family protein, partial [Luteimonas sp.]